jgi:uncharacterized protein
VNREILKYVDPEWGGFQQQQKFPTPLRWRFLMHRNRETPNEHIERQIRHTLDKIADGGIHDHVGGGFHRYTTEETWLVPHFEIMLYDNAQLADLYLEAAATFDDPAYLAVGKGVLDFLIRDMTSPDGGIYASFDADSGGEEGSYYVWSPQELIDIAGETDGPALARLLGVTEGGNFEGHSILTRRVDPRIVAEETGRPEAEIAGLFAKYREVLYQQRATRTPPGLDRKIVTAWNGLALGAFSRAYALTGDAAYLQAASGIVTFLWTHHRDDENRLVRASTAGRTAGLGILDDYAFFAEGLIDLFQATGDIDYFDKAAQLINTARTHFNDADGGFFMTADDVPAPLGRRREIHDNVEPSGASMMLRAMTRLAALTGDVALNKDVRGILERHVDDIKGAPLEMAGWTDVAAMHAGDYFEVVIAGDGEAADTRSLTAAFHESQPANAVLLQVPADGPVPGHLKRLPTLANKTALDGRATAYICRFGACNAPVHTAAEMLAQMGITR